MDEGVLTRSICLALYRRAITPAVWIDTEVEYQLEDFYRTQIKWPSYDVFMDSHGILNGLVHLVFQFYWDPATI